MVRDDGDLRRAEAAISGQLPADKEAATKVLNAVVGVTEAVRELEPLERRQALGIFGELLLTVESRLDLDEVYGLLDRLLQERRVVPALKSPSADEPAASEGPTALRNTTSQA